ncbi:MAG TPA: hypothetical protein VNO34_04140, partial [Actinomycetota bacterium]|nr:hypothetical protein [Actinomycetota bacterium]
GARGPVPSEAWEAADPRAEEPPEAGEAAGPLGDGSPEVVRVGEPARVGDRPAPAPDPIW